MGDLAKRLGTAAVLVPALLVAILLDPTPWSVTAFAAVVGAIAFDEYVRMALPVRDDAPATGLRMVCAITAATVITAPTALHRVDVLAPALAFGAIALSFAVLARKQALEHAGKHLAVVLSGLIYVPGLMAHLPLIKADGKPHWLVVALCTAFFADTVAYFFGRAFGKHKLYPEVSPKKTWEGAFGGILGSMLATIGVGSLWTLPQLGIGHAVVLGIIASVCGQAGDLVESMVKRTFGVKDSGTILPGHGGMLDRIDAMLFVSPVVYYFVQWTQ
ncbi:MAG: phosphatidate cytidylyltransferase [Nannocystaceae bacterium]|nr:phosphatidate cytidylyltransferase [Nannocystaceae bacterium]